MQLLMRQLKNVVRPVFHNFEWRKTAKLDGLIWHRLPKIVANLTGKMSQVPFHSMLVVAIDVIAHSHWRCNRSFAFGSTTGVLLIRNPILCRQGSLFELYELMLLTIELLSHGGILLTQSYDSVTVVFHALIIWAEDGLSKSVSFC